MNMRSLIAMSLGLLLVLTVAGSGEDPELHHASQIGKSFQVPYRLTETNHFLVRVRINGKGPFNFLVDSGAPALYVATETAAKIGLKPPKGAFWTPINRLDLEGGAQLLDLKARVEDPFQLVGMNALGLPGASIDGILGFTILARFRLEIDPTSDRMTWTRLKFTPPDPPVPNHDNGDRAPAEIQVMNALGPIAKGLAFLLGKQPEEQRDPRGFLGLEWTEARDANSSQSVIRIERVIEGSPAAKSGLHQGDLLIRIGGQSINNLKAAHAALATIRPGTTVTFTVCQSGHHDTKGDERTVTITAGEGL
jgi:hypothetical protein